MEGRRGAEGVRAETPPGGGGRGRPLCVSSSQDACPGVQVVPSSWRRVWLRGFSDGRPQGHTNPRGRGTGRPGVGGSGRAWAPCGEGALRAPAVVPGAEGPPAQAACDRTPGAAAAPGLRAEADRTGRTDNQGRAQPSESKQAFLSSSPGPRQRADGREAPDSGAVLVPVAPPPTPPLGAVPFSHQT